MEYFINFEKNLGTNGGFQTNCRKQIFKDKNMIHKFVLPLLATLLVFCTLSCKVQNKENMEMNKGKDTSMGEGKYIITAPVIFKIFIKKNGEVTNIKELYIQRSIQDYYIKFCESKIKREDFENHLTNINGEIKVVTLEIEFRNGNWDICDENFINQSRIGEYIIIHRIIEDEQK